MSSILLLLVVARKNSNGTIEKINGMVSQIIPAKVGNFGSLLDKEERKFTRGGDFSRGCRRPRYGIRDGRDVPPSGEGEEDG